MSIRISLLVLLGFLLLMPERAETGEVTASWYGSELEGNTMANGETFHASSFVAASKTIPLNSRLTVCKEGCVQVKVADRGPFVPGRELDLSEAAADSIGLKEEGVGPVEIKDTSKPITELPSTGGPNESGGLTPPYSLSHPTGSPLFLGLEN